MFNLTDFSSFSHMHRRTENQDLFFYLNSVQSGCYPGNMTVAGVLDGVSNNNGKMASLCAASSMRPILCGLVGQSEHLLELDEAAQEQWILEQLSNAILQADRDLREKLPGSGTTASLAVVFGDRVFTANVGDSPIYLLRFSPLACDFEIESLFECHNLAGQNVLRGTLEEEEALVSPDRNCLLKMVGGSYQTFLLSPDEIHTQGAWLSQNNVLLLGSDGALSVYPKAHIKELFQNYQNQSLDAAVDQLFEDVQNSESDDNFTVIAEGIQTFFAGF